jgi:adenylyltransferase/sulfurtransferase
LTGGLDEVGVEAGTVGDVMLRLRERYPDLKQHLYDERDNLRGFVNLFLNDDDVRSRQGLETPAADGDVIMLIPSIAGGGHAG